MVLLLLDVEHEMEFMKLLIISASRMRQIRYSEVHCLARKPLQLYAERIWGYALLGGDVRLITDELTRAPHQPRLPSHIPSRAACDCFTTFKAPVWYG
jgi:hypothetical protein